MTTQTLSTSQLAALPRVNLLPPEIAEKRRARQLQAGMGAAVAVAVVGVGAVYVMAHSSANHAKSELATAQSQTTSLQAQVAQYAGDLSLRAQLTTEQGMLSSAMGTEIQWSHYLNDLSLRIPDNVWVSQITVSESAGAPTAPAAPGAADDRRYRHRQRHRRGIHSRRRRDLARLARQGEGLRQPVLLQLDGIPHRAASGRELHLVDRGDT